MKIFTVADAQGKLKNNTTKFTSLREELKRSLATDEAQFSHQHLAYPKKTDWEPFLSQQVIKLVPGAQQESLQSLPVFPV